MIINFKFRIFINSLYAKSIYVLDFSSAGLIEIALWYVLLYLSTILSILSIRYIFWNWSNIFLDFMVQGSNKAFSNNRLFFIICSIHFYVIVYCKTHYFVYHFFGLGFFRLILSKSFVEVKCTISGNDISISYYRLYIHCRACYLVTLVQGYRIFC